MDRTLSPFPGSPLPPEAGQWNANTEIMAGSPQGVNAAA